MYQLSKSSENISGLEFYTHILNSRIHASPGGDILECMARSDNVLNTGFCPRADSDSIDLFTATLTFSLKNADEALLNPRAQTKD